MGKHNYTYDVDLDAKTVYAVDRHGERFDLNAEGNPCADWDGLGAFVRELEVQGAITPDVCAAMLAEIDWAERFEKEEQR